jgi:Na+-transporting methylmalonyl-CoA/oxaloacetate decarboxylase gamma subunit
MSLSESILIAVFCMAVVFAVLGILWVLIRLFSAVIMGIEKKNDQS